MDNQLMEIKQTQIANDTIQTVNARELHEFLQVGKDFSNWIKDRINKYIF
ncbi:antA/AntB antirepressor family protein [Bartonella sp. DGB1]